RRGRGPDRPRALRGVSLAATKARAGDAAAAPSDVLLRQHMCGRIDRLYPKMAVLPIDIYEIDFPANLALAREQLGPTRVLAGNVSTITELLAGTPDRVYEACRRCHEIC